MTNIAIADSAPEMSAALRLFWVVWITALGACVGSFLNVVIHRVPRGKSIVYPGSHCPRCEHPIRWYHNIPVLSWLMLRGRCYDCGGAIGVRYPLIEALSAAMFVSVAWSACHFQQDDSAQLLTPPEEWLTAMRWSVCGYHWFLVSVLLCLAMIEFDFDRQRSTAYPWRFVVFAAVVGLLVPAAWMLWLSYQNITGEILTGEILPGVPARRFLGSALKTSLAGAAIALPLGILGWPATGRGPMGNRGHWSALGSLLLVGIFLGAAAAAEIAAITAMAYCIAVISIRFGLIRFATPWSMIFFMMTLVWLVAWTPIVGWQTRIDPSLSSWTTLAMGLSVGGFSMIAWGLSRKRGR